MSKRFLGLMAFVVVGAVLAFSAVKFLDSDGGATTIRVVVPELTPQAIAGQAAFDSNCAKCHGKNAGGTTSGPPLVHDFYNPGHHADGAFYSAVRRGVRQHHWVYGDMPAQPQVTEAQLAEIVTFIRELQKANGIVSRPHRM